MGDKAMTMAEGDYLIKGYNLLGLEAGSLHHQLPTHRGEGCTGLGCGGPRTQAEACVRRVNPDGSAVDEPRTHEIRK